MEIRLTCCGALAFCVTECCFGRRRCCSAARSGWSSWTIANSTAMPSRFWLQNSEELEGIPNRGGAGGGRENIPVVDALRMYADSEADSYLAPLYFLDPGIHELTWPYDTSTATMVIVQPGGGGGGGAGERFLPGEDGENGLGGAVFIFPTDIPLQRPLD